jgi:hypothetical protein
MFEFLKRLGGGPKAPQPAEPVHYEGFQIVATPREVPGGWSTEGLIRKEVDGELKEVAFIRADTSMSREDAVRASEGKARKIIGERGEQVFDGRRP